MVHVHLYGLRVFAQKRGVRKYLDYIQTLYCPRFPNWIENELVSGEFVILQFLSETFSTEWRGYNIITTFLKHLIKFFRLCSDHPCDWPVGHKDGCAQTCTKSGDLSQCKCGNEFILASNGKDCDKSKIQIFKFEVVVIPWHWVNR